MQVEKACGRIYVGTIGRGVLVADPRDRGPAFELFERPVSVEITKSSLTAGRLAARIPETGWAIEFAANHRWSMARGEESLRRELPRRT